MSHLSSDAKHLLRIHPVPILTDNYVWIIETTDRECILIDPGVAKPVSDFVHTHHLKPKAMWITHRHPDHTGGVSELADRFQLPVYGPDSSSIPQVTEKIGEGDSIRVADGIYAKVWHTPGHVPEHIAFLIEEAGQTLLFCGDTLFSAGCGRLLGGTMKDLFSSLQRIQELDDDTLIYCTHEYTRANLQFAQTVEPDNKHIATRLNELDNNAAIPSLPSRLGLERKINPFLRTREASVIKAVTQKIGNIFADSPSDPLNKLTDESSLPDYRVFSELRRWKDCF